MRQAFPAAAPSRHFRILAVLPLLRAHRSSAALRPIERCGLEALRRGADDLPGHLRDFGAAAEIFRLPR